MSDLAEALKVWDELGERSRFTLSGLEPLADAARRVLEGEQWMVCETHESVEVPGEPE